MDAADAMEAALAEPLDLDLALPDADAGDAAAADALAPASELGDETDEEDGSDGGSTGAARARGGGRPRAGAEAPQWEAKLAALRAFIAEHGRLPPIFHPSGIGRWVNRQRTAKKAMDEGKKIRQKMTPQRVAALEALPQWAWRATAEPGRNAAWEARLEALKAHLAAHGRMPASGDAGGLGDWVLAQRAARRAAAEGRRCHYLMTPERAALLEGVPGWAWEGERESAWGERLAALRAFVGAHGRLPPLADALGAWARAQRLAKRAAGAGGAGAGRMAPERAAALESIPGWAWEVDADAAWKEKLEAVRAHVAAHGRLPAQGGAAAPLGSWISAQRRAAAQAAAAEAAGAPAARGVAARLTPERRALLEAIPGWTWAPSKEAEWQERLEAVRAHAAARGGALPPPGHALDAWLEAQRRARRAGEAPPRPGRPARAPLAPARVAALEALPGWSWAPVFKTDAAWGARLATIRAHAAVLGRPPTDAEEPGIGAWIYNQRAARAAAAAGRPPPGRWSAERAAALEAVPGWTWEHRPRGARAAAPPGGLLLRRAARAAGGGGEGAEETDEEEEEGGERQPYRRLRAPSELEGDDECEEDGSAEDGSAEGGGEEAEEEEEARKGRRPRRRRRLPRKLAEGSPDSSGGEEPDVPVRLARRRRVAAGAAAAGSAGVEAGAAGVDFDLLLDLAEAAEAAA
jgi:hypothetical protein